MPCDPSSLQTVGVSAVVEKLQNVNSCMQQCQDAAVVEPEIQCGYGELLSSGLPSYLPTAGVRWKQHKHLAQLRTGSSGWQWKDVALEQQGRSGSKGRVSAAKGSSVNDVEHIITDCNSLEAEQQSTSPCLRVEGWWI